MFEIILLLLFITLFFIIVFLVCFYFIKYYRLMIYSQRANIYIRNRQRTQRVVPETNIEIPELPIPLAEGIKIDTEIEDLEVIQIN